MTPASCAVLQAQQSIFNGEPSSETTLYRARIQSALSDGDDNVAASASSPAQNITVANVNTYSGHGISVGSITKGGLTNPTTWVNN